jgi:hypothetical protein
LVTPVQSFVKTDIRDARYYSHEFLKAQLEYEGGVLKFNQHQQKQKADSKKSESLNQLVLQAQQKCDMVRGLLSSLSLPLEE